MNSNIPCLQSPAEYPVVFIFFLFDLLFKSGIGLELFYHVIDLCFSNNIYKMLVPDFFCQNRDFPDVIIRFCQNDCV